MCSFQEREKRRDKSEERRDMREERRQKDQVLNNINATDRVGATNKGPDRTGCKTGYRKGDRTRPRNTKTTERRANTEEKMNKRE